MEKTDDWRKIRAMGMKHLSLPVEEDMLKIWEKIRPNLTQETLDRMLKKGKEPYHKWAEVELSRRTREA